MTAQILDGKALAAEIRAEVKAQVEVLAQKGVHTALAVVLVGDDPASQVYVRNKIKACADAGIKDEIGREPSPVPAGINKDEYGAKVRAKLGGRTEIPPPAGYQVFAPAIDTFLKEHLFCDIFIRDNLSPKHRELATIGALGAMTGTAGQLNFHLGAALNTGTTVEEMEDYFAEIERAAGAEQEKVARDVLGKILAKRRPS